MIIIMIIMMIKTITMDDPHVSKSPFKTFQVERLKENREKRRAQQAQILEDQEVGALLIWFPKCCFFQVRRGPSLDH